MCGFIMYWDVHFLYSFMPVMLFDYNHVYFNKNNFNLYSLWVLLKCLLLDNNNNTKAGIFHRKLIRCWNWGLEDFGLRKLHERKAPNLGFMGTGLQWRVRRLGRLSDLNINITTIILRNFFACAPQRIVDSNPTNTYNFKENKQLI